MRCVLAHPDGGQPPLRRAALGLIRILLDGELDIELDRILAVSALSMQEQLNVSPGILLELRQFIIERLKHFLREQGYETSLITAVLDAPLSTLPDLVLRLDALRDFMGNEVAENLVAANKRIGNILRKSELSTKILIREDLLTIDEERHLFDEVRNISGKLDTLYQQADYTADQQIGFTTASRSMHRGIRDECRAGICCCHTFFLYTHDILLPILP